jgi:secreted trypsin-like serine protease
VGGTAVPNGKYKFQAALLALSFGSNDFERQYCGGSLITPFEVLTAATASSSSATSRASCPSATCGWWSAGPC